MLKLSVIFWCNTHPREKHRIASQKMKLGVAFAFPANLYVKALCLVCIVHKSMNNLLVMKELKFLNGSLTNILFFTDSVELNEVRQTKRI